MEGQAYTAWFEEEDPERLPQALQSQANMLELSPIESTRRQHLLYDAELYLGTKLSSLYQLNGDGYERLWNPTDVAYNVCYSTVSTMRNRICSFRPRAQFLPNGGDYKARRAARDMTEASDAWAEKVRYQEEAAFAFRDLLTGDGGILKTYIDGDNIRTARFPAWEFYFDEAESIYGEPECAYHMTYLPIEQAARRYKVAERDLLTATVTSPMGIVYTTNRQLVRLVEAWQRGPEGRHVIVAGNSLILDEPWEWDAFPLVVKKFDERFVGMWGDGAVRRLRALQLELIEWQTSVREAHRLTSQQVWLVRENEAAPPSLNNATVRMMRYTNDPAQVINPAAINAEMYQYYNVLKQAAYETLGINQAVAQGQKQPGVDSAVAIRESSELQTDRLALLSQTWEEMRVEVADWWWRFTKVLAKREENPVTPKWRAISRGAWRDVTIGDLDQEYEIRRFPSSVFGQTISGRFQRATELIKGGFMSRDDALKALDVPDLAPIIDLALAQSYAMESLVDGILEDGKYVTPDPQIKPDAMEDYARSRYLLALSDKSNYPEAHMSLLRRLLDAVHPAAEAARKEQAPGPAPPPPAPGASPEQIQAMATPTQMAA